MTNSAVFTAHHANPIPPEGTPVVLVVEGDDFCRGMLVEFARRALPGVEVVAVSNMDMAYGALMIHDADIIGVVTNTRTGGGPQRVIDQVEAVLGRTVPWGILTGALELPSPGDFPHPPVAIVGKMAGREAVEDLFRLFLTPPASPAAGEAS